MIKCKSCGEINLDNSRYCTTCGNSLSETTGSAMKEALENAQKNFEKDALATIDRSRITFVCSVCGTVNSIDQDRCSKCGKPRPRSEFVSALRKVKQGYEYRDEHLSLEPQKVEEVKLEEALPKVEENIAQQPKPMSQSVVQPEGLNLYSGGQANPVVQPFIVVPFVNPNQEIWQYNANQVYRFEPYSQSEMADMEQERLNKVKALTEARNLSENYGPSTIEKTEDGVIFREKTKPIRFVACVLMLLSLAVIVLSYTINVFEVFIDSFVAKPILFFVVGIGECIEGAFSISLWNSIGYIYSGWMDFIAPVAFIVFLLLALILLLRSFARLLRGTAKRKGFWLPLLVLLFFLVGVIGLINSYESFTSAGLSAFIQKVGVGMYLIAGLTVLSVIVSFFSPANTSLKRNKKDLNFNRNKKEI